MTHDICPDCNGDVYEWWNIIHDGQIIAMEWYDKKDRQL